MSHNAHRFSQFVRTPEHVQHAAEAGHDVLAARSHFRPHARPHARLVSGRQQRHGDRSRHRRGLPAPHPLLRGRAPCVRGDDGRRPARPPRLARLARLARPARLGRHRESTCTSRCSPFFVTHFRDSSAPRYIPNATHRFQERARWLDVTVTSGDRECPVFFGSSPGLLRVFSGSLHQRASQKKSMPDGARGDGSPSRQSVSTTSRQRVHNASVEMRDDALTRLSRVQNVDTDVTVFSLLKSGGTFRA